MYFKLFISLFLWTLPVFGAHFFSGGQQIELYPLKQNRTSSETQAVQYYKDNHGKKFGITNQLIICIEDNNKVKNLLAAHQLKMLKKLSPSLYLCQTSDYHRTLDICDQLTHENEVRFAHPNFILHKTKRTADPYYKYLWHLKNTEYPGADINVEEAWQFTKGEGITAAVIDEGIDIDHNDLKANIIGYANYNDPTTNLPVSDTNNWHGTACAGLLAAAENDTGVVGVAPQTKLYAIRYSDTDVAQDIQAFYDLMQKGISVISNSWGSYTNLDAYNEIFKTLATKGRDGKGILIFFAVGNEHKNLDIPGVNDESESPYVISIGSSTHRDDIADYSNYGSALDFLAPGGIASGQLVTTDAMGEKGYTDWNYNFNFIGTSASAPIAAGVGALILSVNPALTRDDVMEILKQTAVKIGDFSYINGRNDYAGYGRIDAGKAVRLARTYHLKITANPSKIDNFVYSIFQSVQKFSNK